jgi:ribonuclease D
MFGETPLVMVEDNEALVAAVEAMRGAPVIGVDTEADSFHSYQEKVCLVQLSDLKTDYIVDPLQVSDMSPLGPIMADPNTVKVLHGADYDIVSLRRDFGYKFDNVFDTMISAQFLGFDGVGLADLIRRFFGHKIDKKYQRHDWSRRPLLPEHLDYARGDTHWLPALRELLELFLRRDGRLEAVREECELVQEREWQGRVGSDADFLRVKGSRLLEPADLKVFRCLWEYRDGKARAADRPAFKLLPDSFLLQISQVKPDSKSSMERQARKGSSMVRRHGDALLRAIEAGKIDERPIPKPPASKKARAQRGGPGVDRFLVPLKDWRNARVKRLGLAPVAVANNTLLKEIARIAPKTLDDLSGVPGIRKWQIQDFGEEVLALVADLEVNAPAPSKRPSRRRNRRRDGEDAE